jgi:hypothetical protein
VKSIILGIMFFFLGAIITRITRITRITSIIGYKIFIGLNQKFILSEMYLNSVSLELLNKGNVDGLQKSNCLSLDVTSNNYSQLETSFWSIDYAWGTRDMTQELISKVKGKVASSEWCKNT